MTINLRLHHVGIVVGNIPDSAANFGHRLGYETKSDVFHDPTQQASVQFVGLPGDNVYLEFVAPVGPESRLSGALSKGGGLHHLCYSVDDIDAACAELRSKGMTLVRPPVGAVAFQGRRIAWLMGRDRILVELVERDPEGGL
jgi:methylmalonyl-CoA/ethylmalonyl-CoA epimerase